MKREERILWSITGIARSFTDHHCLLHGVLCMAIPFIYNSPQEGDLVGEAYNTQVPKGMLSKSVTVTKSGAMGKIADKRKSLVGEDIVVIVQLHNKKLPPPSAKNYVDFRHGFLGSHFNNCLVLFPSSKIFKAFHLSSPHNLYHRFNPLVLPHYLPPTYFLHPKFYPS